MMVLWKLKPDGKGKEGSIHELHMEEDAGKLIHDDPGAGGVFAGGL